MCVLRVWGRHTSHPADPHRGSKGRRLAVALCCFTRRDDFEIYPRGVRVASFVYLTAGEGSSVTTGRVIYPLARCWRSTEGFLRYGRCWKHSHGSPCTRVCPQADRLGCGDAHTQTSQVAFLACAPTLTRFWSLERPLWAAASRPLSLANLCPGSHSAHSISPRPACSHPAGRPRQPAPPPRRASSEPLLLS